MMKQLIKNALRELYWAMQGKGLKNPPLPGYPKSILYVCKGNICRSPFAERLTKKLVEKGANDLLEIRSAGLDATVKNPPPKEAIDSAKMFGVSLDDHKARRLTRELITGSDLIVVMEVKHLHRLEETYPESKDKFFLLSMFSYEKPCWGSYYYFYNIVDPYGKTGDQFLLCYKIIEMRLKNFLYEIGINKFPKRG